MSAKCPKCEAPLTYLRGYTPDVKMMAGSSWKGLVMACPSCSTAISAQIDPIAIKADILNALKKR